MPKERAKEDGDLREVRLLSVPICLSRGLCLTFCRCGCDSLAARIVLPSDELVRVECIKPDARVGDLVQWLATQQRLTTASIVNQGKQQQAKTKGPVVRKRGNHLMQVFPFSTTDHRVSREQDALGENSKDNKLEMVWELLLVRTGTGTCLDEILVRMTRTLS